MVKVTQHIEYFAFGETFLEEHSNTDRTPYLFNGKELDEETGLYYYGARYYDAKTSVWQSVDPLVLYDPVMETEAYLDGQHNGGVFDSGNLASYSYTYGNPVVYIDPNGKQIHTITNGVGSGNNVTNDITASVSRPAMKKINGIVLHRTVTSTASSAINTAKKSKGVPGFHIVMHKNGTTTQLVNFNNRANHVGKKKGKSGVSNFNSIGIEVVGMGYDKNGNDAYHKNFDGKVAKWDNLTSKQIESTANAVYTIMQEYNLSLSDVYNHENVSFKQPKEGGAVMNAIKNRVNELLNPPKPIPPVDSSLKGLKN